MDTQRLISDARRRARMLSRRDGRPLQTHLEEIARTAGRPDWPAFLKDPVEIPEAPPPTADDDVRWRLAYHALMHRSTLIAIPGIAIIAAFIVLTPRFANLSPLVKDIWAEITVLGSMLLAASPVMAFGSAIMLTLSWWYMRPRITRIQLAGVWTNVAVRAACSIAIIWGFVTYAPTLAAGPDPEDAISLANDERNVRHVHVPELGRDLPIARVDHRDGAVDMEVVFIDSRLIPSRMRNMSLKGDFEPLGKSHRLHPVFRFGGAFDCASGRLHVTRIMTADTYTTPPSTTLERPKSKLFLAVSSPDAERICHTSA